MSAELGSRWSEPTLADPYTVQGRVIRSLNGPAASYAARGDTNWTGTRWTLKLDPDNGGVAAGWPARGLPADAVLAEVPGVWNTTYPGYTGVAWYECQFESDSSSNRMRRLALGGANYQTDAWINGRYLGRHEGGYGAFSFRCRGVLKRGTNRLTLRIVDPPLEGEIDGLSLRTCPTAKESWYGGAGGPWGGVWLEDSERVWLADVRIAPDLYGQQIAYRLTFASDLPESASVDISVSVHGAHRLDVLPTGASVTLTVPVRDITPWTPETPALYPSSVTFTLEGQRSPAEIVSSRIGFRRVELRDGALHLNGHSRFIKGALLQPTYPRTLLGSPRRQWPNDVVTAKAAGLNLLRAHLRPPSPAFLRAADRLGMMVYVEPPLGWIEPSSRLLEHGRRELAAMVRACASQPSVVLWGIFNENAPATEAVGGELLAELARLDPTRPIIENSGGAAVGEVDMWAWGGQTRCWSPGWEAPRPLNDLHVYLANPLRAEAKTLMMTLGDGPTVNVTPGRPAGKRIESRLTSDAVFVSEYGCGALPDFDAALAEFGDETRLTDARLLADLGDSLHSGLGERGLDREIGDVPTLVGQTQALQAEGIRAQTLALRRNPRVSGLIVTQLADAGWEQMAGLTGLWRHPRPALEALRQALAPRALHIEPTDPCVTDAVTVRVWLVEDPGLPALHGEAALLLVVTTKDGGPTGGTRTATVRPPAGDSMSRRLAMIRLPLPDAPGRYEVRARLTVDGWHGEARCPVLRIPVRAAETGDGLIVLGQALSNLLPAAETALPAAWRGPILLDLASGPPASAVTEAIRAARQGAHLCIVGIDPANHVQLMQATRLPLTVHGARGNFMGMHHFRKAHPVFNDVGGAGLADGVWAETLPAWALDELPGAEVIAGCFTVKDGGREFRWRAAVQTVPFGKGQITFWQLPLGRRRGGLLGERLFSALVRWLIGAAASGR